MDIWPNLPLGVRAGILSVAQATIAKISLRSSDDEKTNASF